MNGGFSNISNSSVKKFGQSPRTQGPTQEILYGSQAGSRRSTEVSQNLTLTPFQYGSLESMQSKIDSLRAQMQANNSSTAEPSTYSNKGTHELLTELKENPSALDTMDKISELLSRKLPDSVRSSLSKAKENDQFQAAYLDGALSNFEFEEKNNQSTMQTWIGSNTFSNSYSQPPVRQAWQSNVEALMTPSEKRVTEYTQELNGLQKEIEACTDLNHLEYLCSRSDAIRFSVDYGAESDVNSVNEEIKSDYYKASNQTSSTYESRKEALELEASKATNSSYEEGSLSQVQVVSGFSTHDDKVANTSFEKDVQARFGGYPDFGSNLNNNDNAGVEIEEQDTTVDHKKIMQNSISELMARGWSEQQIRVLMMDPFSDVSVSETNNDTEAIDLEAQYEESAQANREIIRDDDVVVEDGDDFIVEEEDGDDVVKNYGDDDIDKSKDNTLLASKVHRQYDESRYSSHSESRVLNPEQEKFNKYVVGQLTSNEISFSGEQAYFSTKGAREIEEGGSDGMYRSQQINAFQMITEAYQMTIPMMDQNDFQLTKLDTNVSESRRIIHELQSHGSAKKVFTSFEDSKANEIIIPYGRGGHSMAVVLEKEFDKNGTETGHYIFTQIDSSGTSQYPQSFRVPKGKDSQTLLNDLLYPDVAHVEKVIQENSFGGSYLPAGHKAARMEPFKGHQRINEEKNKQKYYFKGQAAGNCSSKCTVKALGYLQRNVDSMDRRDIKNNVTKILANQTSDDNFRYIANDWASKKESAHAQKRSR
ncbi:MAG: hypothetical protein ACON35_05370 [Candidatus Marinamargulisbacteria bacterium]